MRHYCCALSACNPGNTSVLKRLECLQSLNPQTLSSFMPRCYLLPHLFDSLEIVPPKDPYNPHNCVTWSNLVSKTSLLATTRGSPDLSKHYWHVFLQLSPIYLLPLEPFPIHHPSKGQIYFDLLSQKKGITNHIYKALNITYIVIIKIDIFGAHLSVASQLGSDLDPQNVSTTLLTFLLFWSGLSNVKVGFLINFTIIIYQVKFYYSLRKSYNTCWNTKGVGNYAGAGMF